MAYSLRFVEVKKIWDLVSDIEVYNLLADMYVH